MESHPKQKASNRITLLQYPHMLYTSMVMDAAAREKVFDESKIIAKNWSGLVFISVFFHRPVHSIPDSAFQSVQFPQNPVFQAGSGWRC